jgi:spindle assembly abnormal protein 6
MKIVLIVSSVKKQKIQIQITNPKDPLVLYLLDISEVEFHQIKTEQSILIDFQNFPSFMIKMINLCIDDNNNKYYCILQKLNLNEALFIIQERNKFRELNHLILNLTQANDTIVKKFLGSMTMEFKTKYNNILNDLNNLNINYKKLSEENNQLKEEIDKNEFERKKNIDNLIIEKDIEINNIKEQSFQESKKKLNEIEKEKNYKISDLENKIISLQNNI